jgi:hypothetical protein
MTLLIFSAEISRLPLTSIRPIRYSSGADALLVEPGKPGEPAELAEPAFALVAQRVPNLDSLDKSSAQTGAGAPMKRMQRLQLR